MEHFSPVLFSAYAQLPRGTASSELYKVMALVLLIDTKTNQITAVDCTLSTRLAEQFVAKLLVGKNILESEQLIELIQHRYQGSARNALITTIRLIKEKYLAYSSKNK